MADIFWRIGGKPHAPDEADRELGEQGRIFRILKEFLDVAVSGSGRKLETESSRKCVKVFERFGRRLFVDPVDESFALELEMGCRNLIGLEHELFDHLVSDIVFDPLDPKRDAI